MAISKREKEEIALPGTKSLSLSSTAASGEIALSLLRPVSVGLSVEVSVL
jgi:hypothetical protein